MKDANIGETIWLAALDNDGKIRRGVCESRWPHDVNGTVTWFYGIRYSTGGNCTYKAEDLFENFSEAKAAFDLKCEESRRQAEAMPPIETGIPMIGDDPLDKLIEAAWNMGYRSAAADEGCGGYPSKEDGDEVRRMANEIKERIK